jgi:hypothetical protein
MHLVEFKSDSGCGQARTCSILCSAKDISTWRCQSLHQMYIPAKIEIIEALSFFGCSASQGNYVLPGYSSREEQIFPPRTRIPVIACLDKAQ